MLDYYSSWTSTSLKRFKDGNGRAGVAKSRPQDSLAQFCGGLRTKAGAISWILRGQSTRKTVRPTSAILTYGFPKTCVGR